MQNQEAVRARRHGVFPGLSGGPHFLSQAMANREIRAGATHPGSDVSRSPPPPRPRACAARPAALLVKGDRGRMPCASGSWHPVPISSEVGVHRPRSLTRMHFRGSASLVPSAGWAWFVFVFRFFASPKETRLLLSWWTGEAGGAW